MAPRFHPLRFFGEPSDAEPLPWERVEQRLVAAETYWVDVAVHGRPHPRPVWGVWLDDQIHLSLGSPTLRAAAVPGCAANVHLDSGLDVVIVEGEVAGATSGRDVIDAYDRKYDWVYDLDQYGPFTTVAPADVLVWRAAGPAGRDGFPAAGRWSFDGA